MAEPRRPASFKCRHFAPEVILCAVRGYLRYSLSYREVQELLVEWGSGLDHTTVWRWVQRYAAELEERTRPHLKPTNKSWRADPGQAAFSSVRLCAEDRSRLRDDAQDSEGTSSVGEQG